MTGNLGPRESDELASGAAPRPGTLTALLEQIAQSSETSRGDRWDTWLRPGAVVAGRFELLHEIGRGGFGIVYEARDRELGRTVAFKAVRAGDRAALREERLVREAEAAARLSHPNIVTLHDVGRAEQGPYLVLELLRGQTLADRLEQGPIPFRESLRIGVEIARGLAHAHAQGVVHRDLKPANVFLCDDGQVKLLDFGLAHALGRRRQDGGTPAFMAPEQWKGAPEDERTDVFALGVLLFRMLSGELPFPDGDEGRAAQSSRSAPRLEVPELPALGALVGKMLRKDPVERPRDGSAVHAALSAFQRELERTPSAPSAPAARARRGTRARVALIAGAAFAVLAAIALATGAWRWARERALQGPVSIAVADFANQTGEAELDGLSGMLITSLEQSQKLSVLTRVRMLDVLRQLGKPNVSVVDEALGREVALSAGVRGLVLATIRRFDQLYTIELKVLDPVKSEYLFTLLEQGQGKASVPAMIDRLSERTRERLRESPAEVQASKVRVAELTTGSLEAYQHYFRGEQLKEAIRYEDAIQAYRKAIAVDPNFALAHYRIAYLGKFTGLDDGTRMAEIDAALRHSDRVPAKERLLIHAWKAVMDHRSEEGHALYARAVETWPQDKEVLFMAGDQYVHEDEWAKGLPYMQKAVALDETFEPALMHLADCLGALGRIEELMAVSRRWSERGPSAPAFWALSMAEAMSGHRDEAVKAARRALDIDGSRFSLGHLVEVLLFAEGYDEVETLLRPVATPNAPKMDRAHAAPALACALAYQGRRREALRVLDLFPDDLEEKRGHRDLMKLEFRLGEGATGTLLADVRAAARQPPPHSEKFLAIALAALGDVETAEPLAASLAPGPRRVYDGVVAWRREDRQGALRKLREAATSGDYEFRGPALWFIVRIASETGADDEVIRAAGELRNTYSGEWRSWGFPQSLYYAALAHERRGERTEARVKLDLLLSMWKHADADLPLLAEAKALRARLGA